MYDMGTRMRALALIAQGRSLNAVSKETGISRAAIRSWQIRIEPLPRMQTQITPCARCQLVPALPSDVAAYSYLLGLYLGDGCISPHPSRGHYLRIACADAWPGLIDDCEAALRSVNPSHCAYRVQAKGYVSVVAYSHHWPCLFPQHGPGKKHERTIALEPWQQDIVDAYPWEFIRGLIHSDGCRITNWTTRLVAGERKRYEYPRYSFANKSDDIRKLFSDTLDKVGVEWTTLARGSDPFNISIARKASVALMDTHVGPKH
ncbi:helix-turn-helix domain-containing protein [Streptomyces ureilyticus]|uniref:Helix-turn-helix domain-containing protein n=1 Tax=Streptomyces ureilyticus TaxID=1775131 RepID=A0ABX0DYH3_9ACTN|nr:helix-turn-helix domain-containing protein [Streptomyces ureilyticus]NGO45695.1 helix-turn-helix domain-containing protein [Streptomyces ureilyticus]